MKIFYPQIMVNKLNEPEHSLNKTKSRFQAKNTDKKPDERYDLPTKQFPTKEKGGLMNQWR